jgi:hypothetical protein
LDGHLPCSLKLGKEDFLDILFTEGQPSVISRVSERQKTAFQQLANNQILASIMELDPSQEIKKEIGYR